MKTVRDKVTAAVFSSCNVQPRYAAPLVQRVINTLYARDYQIVLAAREITNSLTIVKKAGIVTNNDTNENEKRSWTPFYSFLSLVSFTVNH